jgi:hypothetical protein
MKLSSSSRRRKAIAGILAAVIFFAMLFTAGMSLVLYTLTSYNHYNQAQVLAVQNQQAKSAESLSLKSCDGSTYQLPQGQPYTPPGCNVVAGDVGVWVQNTGGVSLTLVAEWILNTTSIPNSFVPKGSPTTLSPPITLNPGSVTVVDTLCNEVVKTGCYINPSDLSVIAFVTSTGNQFVTTFPPSTNGIPTVVTALSPPFVSSFPNSETDTATVSGISSASGYSVEYDYFTNGICTGSGTFDGGGALAGSSPNFVVPASGTPTGTPTYLAGPGPYSFQATLYLQVGLSKVAIAVSSCEPVSQVKVSTPFNAFGLGYVILDFNSFHIYSCKSGAVPGCTLNYYKPGSSIYPGTTTGTTFSVANAPLGYGGVNGIAGISSSSNFVFSANFTNVDPSQRNLVLDSSGLFYLYVLAGGSSNFRSVAWSLGGALYPGGTYVGGVSSTGVTSTTFPLNGIELPFNETVTLFFTVASGGFSSVKFPTLMSGTFYFHGIIGTGCTTLSCIGSSPVGQNEPLVTVYGES